MAQEGGHERTEQATPKRLREAREKGQIARSRELTTFTLLFSSCIGIFMMGDKIIDSIMKSLEISPLYPAISLHVYALWYWCKSKKSVPEK